ncbi:MAG: hypothetical protein AB8B72_14830 [Crocinitomicaceae bacterium]
MNYWQIFIILILSQSCTSELDDEENENLPSNFYLQAVRKPKYIPATDEQLKLVRAAKDSIKINYSYSFGECFGYCEHSAKLSSRGILINHFNWKENHSVTTYHSMSNSVYSTLINSIDFKSFLAFDKYLGCGDCADGGSKTIEITLNTEKKSISGTFGFRVKSVQHLLDFLRGLHS